MASAARPSNVHVSAHPCLRVKLSQLRSKSANAQETKALIHEISMIIGCEALASGLETVDSGTVSILLRTVQSSIARQRAVVLYRNRNNTRL